MNKLKVEFKGIPPSKKNSKMVMCRGGRPTVLPSKAYKKWHEETQEYLSDLGKLQDGEYLFLYHFFIPYNKDGSESKRPFDYSNKIESINDYLVDIGVIEDDNYNFLMPRVESRTFVNYGEGKVILEIEKIEDEGKTK